ncbi:MAG TPA: hypothetical protein ENN79_07760 [Desulfobacteraceae bacterium]|nr:hypothetical protein [Desulfobacteraceae bacterium]
MLFFIQPWYMFQGALMLNNTTEFSEQSSPPDAEPLKSKDKKPEEKLDEKAWEASVRGRELQRARIMDAIGVFAGGIAHDLNNALTGIVSYPELMLMQLPAESPLRPQLTRIQESGRKAVSIVRDLVTLSRRGTKNQVTVLNLNRLIDEYLKNPGPDNLLSHYPSVKIKTDLHDDLLNISGSPITLSNAVMHLVVNAAEALKGSGEIHISTFNRRFETPYKGYEEVNAGEYSVLTVSDSGEAIPDGYRERIFEPFFLKKGMGRNEVRLGMSIVWFIVKDHDGFIDVESTSDGGTTITLYFPPAS